MIKKLFTLLLITHLSLWAQAATNIPAGNVGAATWNLAGSPYLIAGNITVTSTLNIQAGVEVVFLAHAQLKVNGILRAIGSQSQPIVFKRDDTTGWYNDATPNGGWRGIFFNEFNGVDSSLLSYCIVQDVKHGINGVQNDNAALLIFNRGIKISHCEFHHNQSKVGQSVGSTIVGSTKPGQLFEVEFCNIHHNINRVAAFKFDNYLGGSTRVHDNRFHHNTEGGTIFTLFTEMLFENNEVDSNSNSQIGLGTIRVDGGHNIVRGNKIHHNVNQRLAAMACTFGKTTIEKNLICNNQMLDANCGFTDGGGGIHISHNNNSPWDSTEYIVRDNIVANNFTNFFGGGIYIHSCKAWVFNNHFIRNKATSDGAALQVFGVTNQVYIQNNLFFGNESTNYGIKKDIRIAAGTFYTFDYNWIEYPFYEICEASNITLNGDTSHNVINANPQLVNPTTISGHTDNALLRDFHLMTNSTCINAGHLQNITIAPTDYYGLVRISGPKIDIGAHEFFIQLSEGVNDIDPFQVMLYPNPVSTQCNISFAKVGEYTITLYDLTGKSLSTQHTNTMNAYIDMKAIPAGHYLLLIQNEAHEKIVRTLSKY
jgi:hypothetical protein